MSEWFHNGLKGKGLKNVFRLYFFSLLVLAPVAMLVTLGLSSEKAFRLLPLLVTILVGFQYFVVYRAKSRKRIRHTGTFDTPSKLIHNHNISLKPLFLLLSICFIGSALIAIWLGRILKSHRTATTDAPIEHSYPTATPNNDSNLIIEPNYNSRCVIIIDQSLSESIVRRSLYELRRTIEADLSSLQESSVLIIVTGNELNQNLPQILAEVEVPSTYLTDTQKRNMAYPESPGIQRRIIESWKREETGIPGQRMQSAVEEERNKRDELISKALIDKLIEEGLAKYSVAPTANANDGLIYSAISMGMQVLRSNSIEGSTNESLYVITDLERVNVSKATRFNNDDIKVTFVIASRFVEGRSAKVSTDSSMAVIRLWFTNPSTIEFIPS